MLDTRVIREATRRPIASRCLFRLLSTPSEDFASVLKLGLVNLVEDLVDPFPGYLSAADKRSEDIHEQHLKSDQIREDMGQNRS